MVSTLYFKNTTVHRQKTPNFGVFCTIDEFY